jgi:hypothetical protein
LASDKVAAISLIPGFLGAVAIIFNTLIALETMGAEYAMCVPVFLLVISFHSILRRAFRLGGREPIVECFRLSSPVTKTLSR